MHELLLGGIDVFHLVNDRHMRSVGLPGNHCAFVADLGGQVDFDLVRRRVSRSVEVFPELAVRLRRSWRRGPLWARAPYAPRPTVSLTLLDATAPLMASVEGLLSRRLDGVTPWALDVLRKPERDALVLRWFHPLCDGKAAERLLAWLGGGEGEELPDLPALERRVGNSDRLLKKLDRKARLELARRYAGHVNALSQRPILSLASTVDRPLGEMRVVRLHLSGEQTSAFDERVRRIARLGETAVMVHAATKVADAAIVARGFAPSHHIVPVPLSLDPKVGCARMLGNNLTMMLMSLERSKLPEPEAAVASLLEQQRAIVRNKLDVAMLAGLDLARHLPASVTWWLTTHQLRGEMTSFVFSNPGGVTLDKLFGLQVLDAFPLPTVVSPPGFQIIFSRFRGRVTALLVFLDGVVSHSEAKQMSESLREELLPGSPPL